MNRGFSLKGHCLKLIFRVSFIAIDPANLQSGNQLTVALWTYLVTSLMSRRKAFAKTWVTIPGHEPKAGHMGFAMIPGPLSCCGGPGASLDWRTA